MLTSSNSHTARRLGALLLLSVSSLACSSWYVQPTTPQELIATQHPPRVRITRPDRSHIVVKEPQIRGDTLYGLAEHGIRIGGGVERRSIGLPLRDVEEVAVRRIDGKKTALAGGGVVAVVALVITMATLQSEER
jgi:hypothetical protein